MRKKNQDDNLLLSKAWQNKRLVDTNSVIITDKTILDSSKGLFNKRMTGETFMTMCERNTILDDARCQFLATGDVVIKEIPTFSIIRKLLYEHTCRLNLSGKIYKDEFYGPDIPKVPQHLSGWTTQEELNDIYRDSYTKAYNTFTHYKDERGRYIVPYESSIKQLYKILKANISRVELHDGHAGCGKSTAIAKKVNASDGKKLIVSLSNTIGNMFKQKCPGITALSCTAAAFRFGNGKNEPSGYDVVIIDEFSQWGFEWIDLFIRLLVANPYAKFYIMGDIDQIPTFLSSGSIQYSIMKEFPECVVKHETQYRFLSNPSYHDMITNLQKGICPPNSFFKGFNNAVLEFADVIITGTNAHVAEFNKKMLELRTGFCFKDSDIPLSRMISPGVPIICNKTGTLSDMQVFRNTKYTVLRAEPDFAVIESQVDHSCIKLSCNDIDYNFDLGYSMTVNRAQGLEWDNVIVYMDVTDKNLKTYNAMYVACSRGKNSIFITSDDPAKCITEFSGILNKKYTFTNMFKEIKNDEQ